MASRMALVLVTTAALLGGCNDRIADAKAQLAIVRQDGDKDATCAAARKVADAYLQQHDQDGYHQAKVAADIDCLAADIARRDAAG